MCGICGTIGILDKSQRELIVQRMNDAIKHRGPDESGWHSDEHCTLAMRRLSVIDLKEGQQPKYNNAKTSLVFFNGEIYNYKALQKHLEEKGYTFTSNSDTEVIVNLYDAYQERAFLMLKGMFVFCIYNIQEQNYIFARDRFGEKPLFYHQQGTVLSFSSEIKSLLENKQIPRILNKNYLPYYFKASYLPEPNTLLKEVYTLPPGAYMIFKNGELHVASYFVPQYKTDKNIKSLEDAASVVKPVFENAVKRQMISEVPIGAFLSGGIDSSTVVAQMQLLSSKPIKTFNVKFEDAKYDESPIAREVALKLGTEHHELVIPNAEFTEDLFWEIIDHVGLPFPDSSAIPTWIISKEIKQHVTVALSGDGGDELFGGYPIFDWYTKIRKTSTYLPPVLSQSLSLGLNVLKKLPLLSSMSTLRQLERGVSLSLLDEKALPIELHAMFSDDVIKRLSNQSIRYSDLELYPDAYESWSTLRKIMYYRLKYNLPLDMLTKVDRMSMANSLEVRAPFLDADLFEVSSTLPDNFLRNGKTGKLVIREMMKGVLPDSVFNHPKSGFSIPLHRYQNETFEKLVYELFTENSNFTKLLNRTVLLEVMQYGLYNKTNNSMISVYKSSHQLWSLLQLAGWMKRFNIELDNEE